MDQTRKPGTNPSQPETTTPSRTELPRRGTGLRIKSGIKAGDGPGGGCRSHLPGTH